MKRKIAKVIAHAANKAANNTAGKSFSLGTYEIKPPKELLKKKECTPK